MHQMFSEEFVGCSKALLAKPPEPPPTDFGTMAGKTGDLLAGMLDLWTADG